MRNKINIAAAQRDFFDMCKNEEAFSLRKRTETFDRFYQQLYDNQNSTYSRLVLSPAGREVKVWDPFVQQVKTLLMFGSNNYLGLANDPYVAKKVKAAIDRFGTGLGGPPLLNGYTQLMHELEERLAAFKHQEAAMVFSTGYQTNLGLISALIKEKDHIFFDDLSHASFYDGLRLSQGKAHSFAHNDLQDLKAKMRQQATVNGDKFIGVEGVYSMDGDLAPLDKLVPLAKKARAYIILDDAHGSGVLGPGGSGTAEFFGLQEAIDVQMGTFSKSFAVTGGFVAASREIIRYMKFFARSYLFSAALPPMNLAAVLAGLDIIDREPERRQQLQEVVAYAKYRLRYFDFVAIPEAAIISIKIPENLNIRKAAQKIHERGVFLNAIEYPAVKPDAQRFRISFMCEHTLQDVDTLAGVLESVWQDAEIWDREAVSADI